MTLRNEKLISKLSGMGLSRLIFYLASLALLILIMVKFHEIVELEANISETNIAWLGIALLLQLATYYFIALNYKYVIKIKGHQVTVKELYPVAFIVQFLNQVLPSGTISGQIFFVDFLKQRGMGVAEGIGRAILELITMLCAFGLLFIACGFLIARKSILGLHPELGIFLYAFLAIAGFFLIIFFIFQKQKRGRLLNWLTNRFDGKLSKNGDHNISAFFDEVRTSLQIGYLSKAGRNFALAILWQVCVMILDIFSLYFLALAIGFPISVTVAFIAFTLTQFVSMISFVPGGLGVFEGGMTILLITFGLAKSVAVSMALIFRGLIFWLPLPIGWWLYRRYHKHKRASVIRGVET